MRGTTRYILRQLGGPMILISLSLSGVIWLTQSLRFVEKMINDGVSVGLFVYLTALLLPTILSLILPIALFCSVLYAYNRLSTESELVVLWAAGLSTRRLARPAMMLALLVSAICYCLVLYFMPIGTRTFREMQQDFRSNMANILLQEGEFNSLAPGLTVYIRARQSNGELLGILVHDNRNPQKSVTLMAERGMLVRTAEGPRFLMVKGNRQQIDPDKRELSLLYFDTYTLDLNAYAKPPEAHWMEASERFLPQLLWPDDSPNDVQHYWKLVVEGHQHLSSPLQAPALTLIALAAVLGGEFNRRGRTRRIVVAALAALLLQMSALGLANLAVKYPILIPMLYLTPIAAMVGSIIVLDGRLLRRRRIPVALGAG